MFIHVFIFISLHTQYVATSLCWAVSEPAGLVFFKKRGGGSLRPVDLHGSRFHNSSRFRYCSPSSSCDFATWNGLSPSCRVPGREKFGSCIAEQLPFRKGKPN